MNQKKCPKCGESNPPEAVMCWACYTPLTSGVAGLSPAAAGSVAGGTTGAAPIAVGGDDEEKSKPKITPVQMGVLGVGLLAALFFGATQLMGGGTVPEDPGTTPVAGTDPPVVQQQTAPVVAGAAPPPPGQAGPTSAELGFSVVSFPNASARTGVMAILIKPDSGAGSAVSMAKEARAQFTNANRFPVMQVFVFNNQQAAQIFKEHQAKRRNEPLENGDYSALAPAWSGAVARVEFRGNSTKVANPSNNPSGWWRGLR